MEDYLVQEYKEKYEKQRTLSIIRGLRCQGVEGEGRCKFISFGHIGDTIDSMYVRPSKRVQKTQLAEFWANHWNVALSSEETFNKI